ncbi:MAG: T9SS type A sorting domain-containing protein [Weeksellaceae bacterium]|nr:T9SS type A sorting domain-containing protein [Weeksellaceae bacterium]
MKNFTIYFAALFLQTSVILSAQTWVKTSAPTNIQYKEIRTYGNNIIYAFGKSASDPTPQTLVSSFDGGQTWKVGSIPFLYTSYLVATPAGLVGGNGAFSNPTSHYTDDGGTTWKKVIGTETGYFFPAGILPNGKLLYADQLYKSLSVSSDYISLGTTKSTAVTPDFRYFATNPSGRTIFGHEGNFGSDLAFTDDNGLTLTNISVKNLIGTSKQAQMVTYAGNNTFYTAGVNTDVLKSTDNGITWVVCSPISAGTSIISLKANSAGRLIVSKSGNIFVTSTDGGQTFTSITNGLPTYGNGTLGVTPDGKFWVAYVDGVAGTNSGGIYVLEDNLSTNEQNKFDLTVYPNPAKDFVMIDKLSQNTLVSIADASGKSIYNSVSRTTTEKINTSNFVNGLYFIQISNGKQISTQKLIIRK